MARALRTRVSIFSSTILLAAACGDDQTVDTANSMSGTQGVLTLTSGQTEPTVGTSDATVTAGPTEGGSGTATASGTGVPTVNVDAAPPPHA